MKKFLFLFIVMLSTLACQSGPKPADAETEPLFLKTYRVPVGFEESVANIMNNNFILDSKEGETKRIARVSTLPNGTLAVLGPKNIHEGFEQLIKDIDDVEAPKKENVLIECWAVFGMNGKKSDDPTLSMLQPALDKIRPHKDYGFVKLEKVGLQTVTSDRSQVEGVFLEVHPEIARVGERFLVDIYVGLEGQNLKTRLYMTPGQLMVLGEKEVNYHEILLSAHAEPKSNDPELATLFYILKVTNN